VNPSLLEPEEAVCGCFYSVEPTLFLRKQTRGAHPTRIRTHYSSARVAALLGKPPRTLSESQKYQLQPFLQFCPKAHGLRRFAMQFRAMVRWRNAGKLVSWIEAATSSGFRFLGDFARNLKRDQQAVKLAITSRWNNGPMEGHINRLKTIKRQMCPQRDKTPAVIAVLMS
jgi:transposase